MSESAPNRPEPTPSHRTAEELSIEEGSYGRRAVLHAAWSDSMAAFLAENQVVELELNIGKGWRGRNVEFLVELPWLQALDLLHLGIPEITPIHNLHSLRRLGITTYCNTAIDFAAFPKLESCGLEWRKGAESVFGRVTLRELFVNRYKGRSSLPFAGLINLESLAISNAPIRNLDGLRGLSKLRSLRLAGLQKLASLAGLETLTKLEDLDVNTCRAVRSIDEVSSLVLLRKLSLANDGDIESLKPLDKLRGLESVVFYESTNIVDGDLSPLVRQKSLTRVAFMNRRHYSHRREDFGRAYTGQ